MLKETVPAKSSSDAKGVSQVERVDNLSLERFVFGVVPDGGPERCGSSHSNLLIHKELSRPAVSGCFLAFVCLAGRFKFDDTEVRRINQGETCD